MPKTTVIKALKRLKKDAASYNIEVFINLSIPDWSGRRMAYGRFNNLVTYCTVDLHENNLTAWVTYRGTTIWSWGMDLNTGKKWVDDTRLDIVDIGL